MGCCSAVFFYVGAQVYVLSFLLVFAEDALQMHGQDAKYYAGAAGLAFMIGRFVGSFFMKFIQPYKLLMLYSVFAVLLCVLVIYGEGIVTLYALVGIAFFYVYYVSNDFCDGLGRYGSRYKIGIELDYYVHRRRSDHSTVGQ